ncbi:ataxin-1-like isoform X1 [Pipra filicauda]|uniref:Ataxin-1-like isoform X1 n=1 Tax=Pipra filicauda TaxID=649802 RepID=A0A6J2HM52_9PASS|nr:ataxin-1-like isoform X1 [Pipra filicauda]XP_039242111.1 ataxin-1-like isoform X1 [Pipra filicauda]XP_039242112.1 ataxin-1-like isoform X1 [Pipra filicauda]
MRAGHERSQECLPPKKRDLPAASAGTEAGRAGGPQGSGEGPEWARTAGPGPAAPRYGPGEAPEAAAGLTVDQYGMLYKVAAPPATFSPTGLHPVVNVSPLSPAFNVSSPIIQHPGVPFPPIHYTQIPPASLQLIGSHYTVPYAVPPAFLPSPLLSPSTNLAAPHVPHFVPYASLFAEEATPSPQTTSPTHSFNKSASAASPGQVQHHSVPQLDMAPGRIPVYYQMSRLPPGYAAYEAPAAGGSPVSPQQDSQLSSEVAAANGGQRPLEQSMARRLSEAVDSASSAAEDCQPPGAAAGGVGDGQFLPGYQMLGREISVPAHRSTPDTDLEVQRVVGVLASQDYHVLAAQRKDDPSPLNLCHNIPDGQEDMLRNTVDRAGNSQSRSPCGMSPEEAVRQRQLTKGMVVANGKPVLVPIGSEPIRSSTSEALVRQSPDAQARGSVLEKELAQLQPPSSSQLPSHFMKGAIIQLATGELKRVEDLQTQDFVRSAEVSGGLKIDSSTVVDIQESQWPGLVTLHFVVGEQQSKVSIDVPPEHPFFVYGQGWSSCSPGRTAQLFALPCHRLQVGDVCISISLQSMNGNSASQANSPLTDQLGSARERSERTAQGLREPPDRAAERKSHTDRDSAAQSARAEPSQPEAGTQHSWAAPGFQRYSVQAEEPRPSLLRPSFIPQEVKLSIEGRSNAGK